MAGTGNEQRTSKSSKLHVDHVKRLDSVKKYFRSNGPKTNSNNNNNDDNNNSKRPPPLSRTWLSPYFSQKDFGDSPPTSSFSQTSPYRDSESSTESTFLHRTPSLPARPPPTPQSGIENKSWLESQPQTGELFQYPTSPSSVESGALGLHIRRAASVQPSSRSPRLVETQFPYGPSQPSSPNTPHNIPDPLSTSISGRLNEFSTEMASNQRPSSSRGDQQQGGASTPAPGGLQPPQNGSQTIANSSPAQNATAGPTNLSGLVCNVHRTTGREPHALVGATTTVLGDKLYVFGGRMLSRSRPELTSDLYELDLIKRHWTKLQAVGDIPPPRYFHSMCALGDTKLVCYGGMSPKSAIAGLSSPSAQQNGQDTQPEVVVMSDVHLYDVLTQAWTRIPTTNTPQGRYAHCASILPSSAAFSSPNAPTSAIHNNPSSTNPHQGSIGVEIDGFGGAEMIVVGGQDSSNHYIEQISVFNLRSLKWTATSPLGRSCGAYRSVVTPLTGMSVSKVGADSADKEPDVTDKDKNGQSPGSPMLIYSNYNFLDVKLELQVRLPDGQLVEKGMDTSVSPPGLRFPNGGVINGHFVVSGTYLTSSKQEYALWALDLKNLTWGRIDVGGAIFAHGSWNRGVLWNQRSTYVILGHRKRSLVEDYNHRRINFSHVCMVELEAFGLYDNPRRSCPTSGYVSISAPAIPASIQPKFSQQSAGGRTFSSAAERLGFMAQSFTELSDMDLLTIGGERIPVSSHILSRRWGPYFIQLLRESTAAAGDGFSDAATLRQPNAAHNSRNSTVTITPSVGNSSQYSTATTLVNHPGGAPTASNSQKGNPAAAAAQSSSLEIPSAHTLAPNSRPRTLYLPHTYLTVQLLVQFLYTSALPPVGSPLCTPQILCSVLQLARPYQVDGLLEATVERLHQVLDGRNAAAVFNAAAMAAGGGRGTGFISTAGGTLETLNGSSVDQNMISSLSLGSPDSESGDGFNRPTTATGIHPASGSSSTTMPPPQHPNANRPSNLRINTNISGNNTPNFSAGGNRRRAESIGSASTSTSSSTNPDVGPNQPRGRSRPSREIWTADISSVVGLQKRGLRGLMEGRRMRERGVMNTPDDRVIGGPGGGATPNPGAGNNSGITAGPGAKMGLGIS